MSKDSEIPFEVNPSTFIGIDPGEDRLIIGYLDDCRLQSHRGPFALPVQKRQFHVAEGDHAIRNVFNAGSHPAGQPTKLPCDVLSL